MKRNKLMESMRREAITEARARLRIARAAEHWTTVQRERLEKELEGLLHPVVAAPAPTAKANKARK